MPEEEEEEDEGALEEDHEVSLALDLVLENFTDAQVQASGSSSANGLFQEAPSNRHKRKNDEVLEQLETQTKKDEEEDCNDTIACPICMEPWTNSGDHRISCLACGHLFGRSCIVRWLQQTGTRKTGGKCPQCNKKAKITDVRHLYVPRVLAASDGEGQKEKLGQEILDLRNENTWLKAKNAKLEKQMECWKHEREFFTNPSVYQPPRTPATADNLAMTDFDPGSNRLVGSDPRSGPVVISSRFSRFWPVDDPQPRSSQPSNNSFASSPSRWGISGSEPRLTLDAPHGSAGPHDPFVRQSEVPLLGGKVFDMGADSQTVMFSNKIESGGSSSRFGLCKMSLLCCTAIEQMDLPPDMGAIRDIRLSTNCGFGGPGKLALVASVGRRGLSVLSLETNNLVHSYPVKSPPWSCSWDPYIPHLLYSGLQNGSVMVLDLRQTSTPVATIEGCSNRPVHTLHVLPDKTEASRTGTGDPVLGKRELLSASVAGIFHWSLSAFSGASSSSTSGQPLAQTSGQTCIFSAKEKLCLSLAYNSTIDTAVASFRQVPLPSANDPSSPGQNLSQSFDGLSAAKPSPAALAQEDPSHWIFKRPLGASNSGGSRMGVSSSNGSGNHGNAAPWQWVGGMSGHRSPHPLMPRGAIVSEWRAPPGSKPLFAGGDEGTKAVWLWDMDTFRVTQTLLPHESPVLDVKHVHMHGKDLLGCLSDRTFQLYRKQPRGF